MTERSHRTVRIVHKALAVVRPQFRLHFEGGIHGLPHWSRVWCHRRALAASLDVDPAVLAWLAFLHDSQRHNDNRDPAHGSRAADLAVRLHPDRLCTPYARQDRVIRSAIRMAEGRTRAPRRQAP